MSSNHTQDGPARAGATASTASGSHTSMPLAGQMAAVEEPSFWRCATAFDGAITSLIAWDVLVIGLSSIACVFAFKAVPELSLEVGPVEIAGGALGLMLVFRSNAGYERWWEGRKIWGQITNATRTLVQAGLAYGPSQSPWRSQWVQWCACFPHAARMSLRATRDPAVFEPLVGATEAQRISEAIHMPSYVTYRLSLLLAEANARGELSAPAFINMEAVRAQLVAAIGACERIASTPLPRVYVLNFRRFLAVYLLCLPAALAGRVGWATPFLTMLVAYPTMGLDRIAQELQAPFNPKRVSHLPLDSICAAIEQNSLGLLKQVEDGKP